MKALALVTAAVWCAVSLAACGGDTPAPVATVPVEASAAPTPTPSATEGPGEDELVAAVTAYSEACLGGEASASYEMRSERLRDRMSIDEWKTIVAALTLTYGDVELKTIKVVQISDGMARVTYRYSDPELDQVQEPWVVEDGAWRVDE